ncbi:MCE family protein [Nocardioides lianchengensis]|uniref:Phospholipid/cholesterol/gamma-HCH transport system substrate-binding protein n=1 Tax=Nocardioides lianchengensis TaxID=1045774 RepID=A0A1G6RG64_9ACTN|nr:MlaD family protein [Nocardioides lianchengensis]NYG10252.1 phospholipid/cholesterol/gamma-HCH transport system substrate-binding protein [Nocardioides lianchengensis]SDD03383.1 phospholipid/cholesterol/gamma-HCH transport system substrate-binding protein [Nocardioides lianchengensis]
MTRGNRIRILAFVVLSAVGIVYITATYLGFVDRVLGRGITVHATLPASGGLFEGSEVTYRGVKVGKVKAMHATRDGVRLDLALEEGTELPLDSPMFVHNLSAVGEQYLDFEPPDDDGPYAEDGATIAGSEESLPVDEADLLVEVDQFVSSVDQEKLQVVVEELGTMFQDTGAPLQRLLDNGRLFVDEAAAHTDETVKLLDSGLTVLDTQQGQGENIRSFSRDLSLITKALRESDRDLRGTLDGTPGTAREVRKLLEGLEPSLQVLLGNAISVNQVVVSHLAGVEQLLVTYPRVIASGFTGTPGDGYGHVNLQLGYSQPPCTKGYLPPDQWRGTQDLTDGPIFPARCESPLPYAARGANYVPDARSGTASSGRAYRSSYDPESGVLEGAVDQDGDPVRYVDPGNLSILGGDSWKWLLVGPVASK